MPHGKLSPSKSHRWLVCSGSQFFDNDGPESSYAEDGQLGHDVLERVLKGDVVLTGDDVKGRPAPVERIQQAIEIRDWLAQWKTQHPDFIIESESHVSVSRALSEPKRADDLDGTADIVAYSVTKKELVIVDAKFGFVRVEPKENSQLYLYAVGAINELLDIWGGPNNPDGDDWVITVIIAQPDYEGLVQFREHRMKFDDLLAWLGSQARNIEAALNGSTTLDASSEHACRYCPNRATCQPRQEVLMKFAQEEWRMTKTLGELLPLLPQIRRIADDLEAYAMQQLAADMTVPGYKLVESRSIRQWTPNYDIIEAARQSDLGIKAERILSPAQVEKAHGARGKAFTKQYAITPRGRAKLAPDSDPRPPYKPENFTQEEIDEMLKGE